jgi:hypothetical protein
VVQFVRIGNRIESSKDSDDRAAGGAASADSNSTLEERMAKLDDMELVDKNQDDLDETSDIE